VKSEGASALERSRHGAERLKVLDDLSPQVADVDLVGKPEIAGGHDPERALVQGEIRELPADLLEEGSQGFPIGHVSAGIQAPEGLEVPCRALPTEP
jgi:hypothetical protein